MESLWLPNPLIRGVRSDESGRGPGESTGGGTLAELPESGRGLAEWEREVLGLSCCITAASWGSIGGRIGSVAKPSVPGFSRPKPLQSIGIESESDGACSGWVPGALGGWSLTFFSRRGRKAREVSAPSRSDGWGGLATDLLVVEGLGLFRPLDPGDPSCCCCCWAAAAASSSSWRSFANR